MFDVNKYIEEMEKALGISIPPNATLKHDGFKEM